MEHKKEALKNKIINEIKKQGFIINPHLRPPNYNKQVIKNIHERKRNEQLSYHKKYLEKNFEKMTSDLKSGPEIDPNKIDLELRIINSHKEFNSKLFFWWNLIWWSLPYNKPIGRQIRVVIWDTFHDCPFGLLGLQSPPLRSKVRDEYLDIRTGKDTHWINQSLYGQRIGALPPYNQLLGTKMVVLSMVSNELREYYKQKYENKVTHLNRKILPSELLFFTTTGAFGKSSAYDRIRYNGMDITKYIGKTTGRGTFHIPQTIYEEMLSYIEELGEDVKRGYGTGPSRKLYLIRKATHKLGLSNYIFHNIQRSYYIIHNVKNLSAIIHSNDAPQYYDRSFDELFNFWKKRWCIPRSNRINEWKKFNKNQYIEKVKDELNKIKIEL